MRQIRKHPGQSLIEFALIFPILFLLIAGFFDLGRAVFYYSSLSNSVREGTRYAIVHEDMINDAAEATDYMALKQRVIDYSFGIKAPLTIDVVVNLDENDEYRESISITGTLMYTPVTPGIKQLFGGGVGIPIVAQSTMRIEPIGR